MIIKNKYFVLLFRIALVLGCGYGLFLNTGILEGRFKLSMFLYYTILSNLVCFIYFLILTIRLGKGFRAFKEAPSYGSSLKGAFTLMITITFLIYHFVLAPTLFTMATDYVVYSVKDIIVHYYVPIMVILDWLLFDKKNSYKWYDPLCWLIIPFSYFIFTVIRAQFGGPITPSGSYYPCFFIDVNLLGWSGVLINVFLITIGFTILGYVFYLVDKIPLIAKKLKKTSKI